MHDPELPSKGVIASGGCYLHKYKVLAGILGTEGLVLGEGQYWAALSVTEPGVCEGPSECPWFSSCLLKIHFQKTLLGTSPLHPLGSADSSWHLLFLLMEFSFL